jgi:hypothetical protein
VSEIFEPAGTRFFDLATGRHMLLVAEGESHAGWLCYRHPDGQWVTLRKATEEDRAKLAAAPEKELLCPHMNFAATINVGRLTDGDHGPVTSFLADITVNCADCGLPFSFQGLPYGLDLAGAMCSPDGTEARLAITPGATGLFVPKENR